MTPQEGRLGEVGQPIKGTFFWGQETPLPGPLPIFSNLTSSRSLGTRGVLGDRGGTLRPERRKLEGADRDELLRRGNMCFLFFFGCFFQTSASFLGFEAQNHSKPIEETQLLG